MAIVPPVAVMLSRVPSEYTPITLATGIESELLLVPEAIVTVATATTPLPIRLVPIPLARHFTNPLLAAQFTVSLTAVSAGPGATVKAVTSLDGYENVHCRAVGAVLLAAKERFRETDPPLVAEPEARFRDETCA